MSFDVRMCKDESAACRAQPAGAIVADNHAPAVAPRWPA